MKETIFVFYKHHFMCILRLLQGWTSRKKSKLRWSPHIFSHSPPLVGIFFISLKLTVFSQRFFEFCLLFICQPWKEALRWYLLCISYKNLASNFVSWILAINALCRTFSSALYNRSWIVCLWWVFFFVISQFDRLAQLHLKYQCIRRSTSFTNSQFHIAVGFRSFIMGGGSIFD